MPAATRDGLATLRTSLPVRTSERTTKVTVAGLLKEAANSPTALTRVTEDSIKQIRILMFYFSATALTGAGHPYNGIISA